MYRHIKKGIIFCLCLLLSLYHTTLVNESRAYASTIAFHRVLYLNSYGSSHDSFSDKYIGVKDILDAAGVRFDMEFLDSKRLNTYENYENFYNMLKYRIENTEPYSAIIVSDDDALIFAMTNQESLFKDIPIVFLGINSLELAVEAGKNPWITGVVESISVKETIAVARSLQPKAKRVLALVDETITGQANLNMFYEASHFFPELVFSELNMGAYALEEYLSVLRKTPEDTIVIYLAAFKDMNQMNLGYLESTTLMSKECPVPVYQISDVGIGHGILGGYVIDFVKQGKEAAKMVVEVLGGRPVEDIDVMVESPNAYKFDYQRLKDFDLDDRALPLDTLLLNSESSLLQQYLPVVVSTLFLIVIQVLIIILLVLNIRRRHVVEQNLEDLNETLENRVKERTNELKRAMKELQQKEKMASLGSLVAGISHEVNTPLGIAVTAGSYLVDQNQNYMQLLNEKTFSKSHLSEYMSTVGETSDIIHRNVLRAAELVKSFKNIAVSQTSEAQTVFNVHDLVDSLALSLKHELKYSQHTVVNTVDPELKVNSLPGVFTQILTNLMMNSIVHGFSQKENGLISISALVKNETLTLVYKDNGIGISPEIIHRIYDPFFTTNRDHGGSGLGLNIVYTLVTEQLKGNIYCSSQESEGTTFQIVIPSDPEKGA